MIIDLHTHAFPRVICDNRSRFFDNEPAFKLLYDSANSRLVDADAVVSMMDEQGVDKSVIFGFPWRSAETFKMNNDDIIEAVDRHPDRLIGFCCLDPRHPDAPEEVDRCLQAGLSGIGELAFYTSGIGQPELECLDPIMALARRYDCPIMLHTNEPVGHAYPGKSPNTLIQIYTMIQRFQKNRIILAHWGGGIFFYSLLKKQVREVLANVWFDTAASPYLYQPQIYRLALTLAGPDRVVLGSDYPLLEPRRYFKEMEKAQISDADRKAICSANALNVLKLR